MLMQGTVKPPQTTLVKIRKKSAHGRENQHRELHPIAAALGWHQFAFVELDVPQQPLLVVGLRRGG